MRSGIAVTVLCAIGCGACGNAGSTSQHVAVTDSAGIEIVTSRAPQWQGTSGWFIEAMPAVQVGVIDGDERLQFQRVRDVDVGADGWIVVANGGSSEIRVFDPTGAPAAVMGGQGGGPGEFQLLAQVFLAADTIIAYDLAAQRFTYFDRTGALLRTVSVSGVNDRALMSVGRFADGSYLMKAELRVPFDGQVGLRRQRETLHHVSAEGALIADIGEFPGQEIMTTQLPSGQPIAGGGMFSRSLSVAVHDTMLFLGAQQDESVMLYDRVGGVRRILRRPATDLTITAADMEYIRSAIEENAAQSPEPAKFVDQMLEMWPAPERKPADSGFQADPHGNLWIGAPANTILSEQPASWTVHDPEGRLLGTVAAPPGVRVLDISRDVIAGVWRDENDVEYIHVYRINRSRGS